MVPTWLGFQKVCGAINDQVRGYEDYTFNARVATNHPPSVFRVMVCDWRRVDVKDDIVGGTNTWLEYCATAKIATTTATMTHAHNVRLVSLTQYMLLHAIYILRDDSVRGLFRRIITFGRLLIEIEPRNVVQSKKYCCSQYTTWQLNNHWINCIELIAYFWGLF